jgi:hypothetical protein
MRRAIELIEGITMEGPSREGLQGLRAPHRRLWCLRRDPAGATDGLLHISQIGPGRVHRVSDVLKEGDEIQVKVLEIDQSGKIRSEPQGGRWAETGSAPRAATGAWCGAQRCRTACDRHRAPGRVPSVTIGIWVESGSRFEPPHLGGHLPLPSSNCSSKALRGAAPAQIAEGDRRRSAGSSMPSPARSTPAYYARVLAEHATLAMDLLADLFLNSRLDSEEIDRERTSCCRRSRRARTRPDDYIHDLFNEHYWPGHPLGRPVCGTSATVQTFARDAFVDFLGARYRPDRADHLRRRQRDP